ncbi:uncharacterized protein LOC125496440 [Beta vulgaris subsp. vulgaris]|uniref:uncharacterized protein LOC125496440 n=1 Tax=Beta vulgaris subsp. vulgaris TaxID=3555 RepID=UPI002037614C|nr:uncharacterized protein LOC125496440 [Beta vulgaris subsp. vulgaris]
MREINGQRCILAIPLSLKSIPDELTWAYSKDGLYSVKIAYMLGKRGNLDDFHRAWGIIWSLEVSPKVRHFLWRICTNSLPVRAALKRRHVTDDDRCPRCSCEEEYAQHAFFDYTHAIQLYDSVGCKEIARNKLVFENCSLPLVVVALRVGRQVDEFIEYTTNNYGGEQQRVMASSSRWLAPPNGIVKLNSDVSIGEDGWIGLGVVARDSRGKILFSVVRRIKAYWPSEVAECKVVHMAIRLAKSRDAECSYWI